MPDHRDEALIAELRALSRQLDVPEPADQRATVRARLTRPQPGRRRLRLWIISAVAAIAGTVGAVAPARAAVVDAVDGLLRVAGIEVRREPAPAALPTRPSPLPSLRSAGLEEARRVARFPVRVPAELGEPERVSLADPDDTGAPRVVTLAYRGDAVRFDQFDGEATPTFFKTAAAADWVEIGTGHGIWVSGPHPVTYVDRGGAERTETARLAGPTLIWVDGDMTYRLEGMKTLEEARTIALSVK